MGSQPLILIEGNLIRRIKQLSLECQILWMISNFFIDSTQSTAHSLDLLHANGWGLICSISLLYFVAIVVPMDFFVNDNLIMS